MNLASRGSTSARPRGFASIFALFLIVVVTTAMVTLTSLMQTDARRTTSGAVDAQLRQLLHAGAVEALRSVESAASSDVEPFAVSLPAPLKGQDASVRIRFVTDRGSDVVQARIDAAWMNGTASQTIHLVRRPDGWTVRHAGAD